jgi:hypothetical protein
MPRVPTIVKFVAIQVVVLFALSEVALRVLEPRVANLRVLLYMPSIAREFDDVETLPDLLNQTLIGYNPRVPIAGFVRNSRGFRTVEYETDKAEGTQRIVVIGDSFAFSSGGIPYSDGWHLLLVVLFVGNDFTDHARVALEDDLGTTLAARSYTARLIRNGARVLRDRRVAEIEADDVGLDSAESPGAQSHGGFEIPDYRANYPKRRNLLTPDELTRVESTRIRLCDHGQSAAFDELLARLESILRDLRDEVEAAGTDFRLVILPDRFQVNLDERDAALALVRMREDQFDWEKPQRRLAEFLDREGFSYLDLLPAFRDASTSEQMFHPGNTHWNIRGNAFVADEIAEWLKPKLPQP